MIEMQGVLIHEPQSGAIDFYNQDDRANVSPVHRELQHRSLRWLANRVRDSSYGSVEIPFGYGNVDALSVCWPTARMSESATGCMWSAAVVLFEAKASRSDFMATFGTKACILRKSTHGNLNFLVKPKKVDMPTELLPEGWGVLEASGRGLRTVQKATWLELERVQDTLTALYRILDIGKWGKRQLLVSCPDCEHDAATRRGGSGSLPATVQKKGSDEGGG